MKKAAKLLDSLMGPGRNLAESEKSGEDFKKKDVCKPYLVGCCPSAMYAKKADPHGELTADLGSHGATSQGGGKALRECKKQHSKAFRAELANHPDAEKYKSEYERELMAKLSYIIEEAQDRGKKLKKKCRPPDVGLKIPEPVRKELESWTHVIQMKQQEAEALGNKGDVAGAQEAADEARKAKEKHDALAKADFTKQFPGEDVCEQCGIIYFKGKCMEDVRGGKITDQYEDEHFGGEQHATFKAIIDRLECLKEKYKDAPPPETNKEENRSGDRRRSRSRSEGRRGRGRDDSRDRRGDRRRGDEGRRGRGRDDSRDRRGDRRGRDDRGDRRGDRYDRYGPR